MASVQKFAQGAVAAQIGHTERRNDRTGSPHIDPARLGQNWQLSPDRGMSGYEYYKQRIGELRIYNGRRDIKTMAGWIVTAPRELPIEQQRGFFREVYNFLESRYGRENVVVASVHMDEVQPHLHFDFIPEVGGRVCAAEVLTRKELRRFHPELQTHLSECGINARVQTGITVEQGGNRSVHQLKQKQAYNYERDERTFVF